MPVPKFNSDTFRDLLPFYYRRLFPYDQFFEWVTYGNENHKWFNNREFSFTLEHDIYVRYQSFENVKEMELAIKKSNPHKIDIGAIFDMPPKHHKRGPLIPLEKELVFDIDMTDYDDVRSCCQGADVCTKCWKFMGLACKILDRALRDDFGYTHLLWVFSGRRGIHCWVCDESARNLDNSERAAVVAYLQNDTTRYQHPKRDKLHSSLRRACSIIEQEFVETLIIEQDILGTVKKVKRLIDNIPPEISKDLLGKLGVLPTSEERWQCVVSHVKQCQESTHGKGLHQFALEDIMLFYAYPRLDVNVSTSLNHLLKAPFCIHPKTGKVCVPFNPKTVDKFDPTSVPTLSELVEEIRVFGEKEKKFAVASNTSILPSAEPLPQATAPRDAVDADEKMDTCADETDQGNVPPEAMDSEALQTDGPGQEGKEAVVRDDVSMPEPADSNPTEETPVAEQKTAAEQEVKNAATHNNQVIKDYKKTSMYKGILVFESFLRKLKVARSGPSGDMEDEI